MFIFIFVQILLILSYNYNFLMKHFIVKEINMIDRYGKDSWVLVTGCSMRLIFYEQSLCFVKTQTLRKSYAFL